MRTDNNNNPAAFTVDVAKQAGLRIGVDYRVGTPFPAPSKLCTAYLIGDPIEVTRRVISQIGYYTKDGSRRWDYIAIPAFIWNELTPDQQRDVIGFHYQREGGVTMRHLFPNYGKY